MITLTECRCREYTDFDGITAAEKKSLSQTREPEIFLLDSEKELIARVVRAEAGNQDFTGKRLVVDCVLNRIDDEFYPINVVDICCQNGQFVVARYYTEDDMLAVEKELIERLDYDIIFFRTNCFHNFGTPCFQHGAHFFSKR